ncbi:MAG: LysE family transporter [Legionellales bacterium]|nr:LysE family transporter [Legionellales bacterium]
MRMLLFIFLQAWMIGIAVAAPVGPIGLLCIRRALENGMLGAISVGLGAALADSVFGLVAAGGFAGINNFLSEQIHIFRLLGGCFLLYLGYKEAFKSNNKEVNLKRNHKSLYIDYQVFLLTMTNPMTILTFMAIFSGLRVQMVSILELSIVVTGVFFGSMTWWFILGKIVCKIQGKMSHGCEQIIRVVSAFILVLFGIIILLNK